MFCFLLYCSRKTTDRNRIISSGSYILSVNFLIKQIYFLFISFKLHLSSFCELTRSKSSIRKKRRIKKQNKKMQVINFLTKSFLHYYSNILFPPSLNFSNIFFRFKPFSHSSAVCVRCHCVFLIYKLFLPVLLLSSFT